MLYFEDIQNICTEYLSSNWNKTPIAYDNVTYTPVKGQSWIRCGLRPVNSENASIGDNCKRDSALFYIQIFTPVDTGSGKAYQYAKELEILFSNKVINGVNFYQADTNYVGDDGLGWFQLNVLVPCWTQTN